MPGSREGGDLEALFGFQPTVSLTADTQHLLHGLMLHKSTLSSSWGQWLVRLHPDAEFRKVVGTIMRKNMDQAGQTIPQLQAWDPLDKDGRAARDAARAVEAHLVETMRTAKVRATEAYLATAMRAPTAEIRQNILDLADLDRQHDDSLRKLLGRPTVADQRASLESDGPDRQALGAHPGREDATSLRQRVHDVVRDLRDAGQEISRVMVSSEALRHLRDEGAVDDGNGTVFDVAVDVDFGWQGECFSVETRDRVALAEIVTSMRSDG